MSTYHVHESAVIDARPDRVYSIIADYTGGHQEILPRQYFKEMVVEQGGKGAGTVVRANMEVMGAKRFFRLFVTEPEPGRVIAEADAEAGVHTTFTVDPYHNGQQSRVTIASDFRASPGLKGVIERLFNPSITRRIYRTELQQLDEYARR